MPTQDDVGFVCYFDGTMAMHDSYWWDWKEKNEGFYGSHGCVNLPTRSWEKIQVGEQLIAVSEFVYRWVKELTPDYDEITQEFLQIPRVRGAGMQGNSVKVIVVESADELSNLEESDGTTWESVIDHLRNLKSREWILPKLYFSNAD
jgi:hypothetical protein